VLGGTTPTPSLPFTTSPPPAEITPPALSTPATPVALVASVAPAAPAACPPEQLPEPLSQAEARILRFLQTSLSAPEIARELYVSVNTVRTHMRHLYDKLGAHRRLEALDRARALGLLAPVPHRA
jgi:LuxR family maltose regulon positive regulatory protein